MNSNFVEDLSTFLHQMEGFKEGVILVEFIQSSNTFVFRQANKTVMSSSISHLYLPCSNRYGILTFKDYVKFMSEASELLVKVITDKTQILIVPKKGRTELWDCGGWIEGKYYGPTKVTTMKYQSFTNWIIVQLILRFYNEASHQLLKFIKNK